MSTMLNQITWNAIDAAAEALGAKDHARTKWRQRKKVPAEWQIKIVEDLRAKGVPISFADFDRALGDGV